MANFEEHKKVTRAGAETVKREAWKTKLEKKMVGKTMQG